MIRLGLCCIFKKQPIIFRNTTAKHLATLDRPAQLAKLSNICLENSQNLAKALQYARDNGIGAFRISSPLFPRYTHPQVAYNLEQLPDHENIAKIFRNIKNFRTDHDLRLSFHPDQFVILSTPHIQVLENSLRELSYQGMLAELCGAEVINIHGGGAYNDKTGALKRFIQNFLKLTPMVQSRLSLENDDKIYTVRDLLPVCEALNIPLVYDVHHHRCNPDGLRVEQATELSIATWERVGKEPYFHLSSPKNGWKTNKPEKPHADFIDPADFPDCWRKINMNITVDVEAKAKELAVLELRKNLIGAGCHLWSRS